MDMIMKEVIKVTDRAESDDELSDEEAVPFKCIGAAHRNHYQHHL